MQTQAPESPFRSAGASPDAARRPRRKPAGHLPPVEPQQALRDRARPHRAARCASGKPSPATGRPCTLLCRRSLLWKHINPVAHPLPSSSTAAAFAGIEETKIFSGPKNGHVPLRKQARCGLDRRTRAPPGLPCVSSAQAARWYQCASYASGICADVSRCAIHLVLCSSTSCSMSRLRTR